jgi:hypothetical protein
MEHSRERNVYTRVQQDESWMVQSNELPDALRAGIQGLDVDDVLDRVWATRRREKLTCAQRGICIVRYIHWRARS